MKKVILPLMLGIAVSACTGTVHNAELEVTLSSTDEFNLIRLRDNIKLGQRIDSVRVEIWNENKWQSLAKATSIGANRLIKLEKPITAEKLKLTIYAPVSPTLSDFALFKEANIEDLEAQPNNKGNQVEADQIKILDINELSTGVEVILHNTNKTTWINQKGGQFSLVLELQDAETLTGLGYLPRQDGQMAGVPTHQLIAIEDADPIKYRRFTPQDLLRDNNQFSVSEITLFK